MKKEKNYFRNDLISLHNGSLPHPLIVSGKYKHTDNLKWATFTTIRPYIPPFKTYTLCNHLNIKRSAIDLFYNLNDEYHNRKFYLVGFPVLYNHYGEERGAIKLVENFEIKPIIFNDEIRLINIETIKKLNQFCELAIIK